MAVHDTRGEENRKVFLSFYDAFNRHDEAAMRECLAADFVNHEADAPVFTDDGTEGVMGWARDMWTGMPDVHFDVHDIVVHEDRAAGRLTMAGNHTGPMMGIPPTGRRVEINSIDMVRFVDGLAAEHWGVTDVQKMMTQLGLAPAPGVVETVSAIYEAFGRQDIPTIIGMMAEDVRWEDGMIDHGVPWLHPGTGPDAVAGFFQALGERLAIDDLQVRGMMASGDQVAVVVDITLHDRESGQDLSDPGEVHLWTVRDGRVTAFRHHLDTHRHVLATR